MAGINIHKNRARHFAPDFTVSEILTLRCLTFKKYVKVSEHNFAMLTPNGKYRNLQKSSSAFIALALTVSNILTFHICDLQRISLGPGLQFSQWYHSVACMKIYKHDFYFSYFRWSSTCAHEVTNIHTDTEKRSRPWLEAKSQVCLKMRAITFKNVGSVFCDNDLNFHAKCFKR